jgi:hypothetical protein
MALAHARAYRHIVLVTSQQEGPPGVHTVRHGPEDESGLLLRVVGPAAANAVVMRLAEAMTAEDVDLDGARARAERAIDGINPRALTEIAGLVAVGTDVTLFDGLRHKLLEGLGRVHPVWDLCGLVHGPLQSFYDRRATLVLLEREGAPRDLVTRLEGVLHPERHSLVRLRSSLPGPLPLLDLDLQLDWVLLSALRAAPRDLVDWPGKGRDAALYELGREG